jgi:pimeloyl-ACP methyl ester carboxylesterase
MRFVLVHGASHGAWCWDLLVPELNQLGHEAVALDLPGHGMRATETATLRGYRDAVVEQLAGDDVLVGHSMGSAVAALAADARPDLVRHITLLSGPLPVEGQCLSYQSTSASVGGSASDDALESVSEDNVRFTDDGSAFYWDRDGAYATFFHDCDEKLGDWAAERLVPQALAPVVQPISIPRFWAADLPRSYILTLQDRAWPPRIGRLQARRMGVEPLAIDSSHSPFFSQPAELARLLVRAVDTTPVGPLTPGDTMAAADASRVST